MFPSLIASANTAMHDRTFSDVGMLCWLSRNFLAAMTAITVQALLPMEMPKIVDCAIWCGRSQSVTLLCVLILYCVLPVDPTVSACDVGCACLGQTLLAQIPSLQWGHWTSLFFGNLTFFWMSTLPTVRLFMESCNMALLCGLFLDVSRLL